MDKITIKSCKFCGKLFKSMGSDVCPVCSVKLDEDFIRIREYLYDDPENVNINEIAEKTGVAEKTILYFVNEGRLSQKLDPSGSLKCAICGAQIRSGRLCQKCLNLWNAEMHTGRSSGGSGSNMGLQKKNEKMHTNH
ncbi:MAG: hypothetical protein AB7C97_03025 [Oscillospiraceae bacterium]